jgi:hypothetical protein
MLGRKAVALMMWETAIKQVHVMTPTKVKDRRGKPCLSSVGGGEDA